MTKDLNFSYMMKDIEEFFSILVANKAKYKSFVTMHLNTYVI